MATVVYTLAARDDSRDVLETLETNAGMRTACEFAQAFEDLYERLSTYPEAYALRAQFGPGIRAGIVSPYLILYRHDPATDTVTILRLLDGRRQIGPDFMQLS